MSVLVGTFWVEHRTWPFNNTLFEYTIYKDHYFVFRITKGVVSVLYTVDPNNSGFPGARGFSPGLFVRFIPTVFPLNPSHTHANKHTYTYTYNTNIYIKHAHTHTNIPLVYPLTFPRRLSHIISTAHPIIFRYFFFPPIFFFYTFFLRFGIFLLLLVGII